MKHDAAIAAADATLLVERARVEARRAGAMARVPLIALSGVDGAGKGTLAAAVTTALGKRSLRVASITLDAWHRPREERMGGIEPARRFYEQAFRFDELFDRLIEPLRRARSVNVETDALDFVSDTLTPRRYEYKDVDVILLEGIFLFRRELAARYDRRWWIDCAPETALARALARNQEGLDAETLRREYETVYQPAQRLHLQRDQPIAVADLVFDNG